MAYALLISTEDVKKFTITNGNLDADDFIEYIKISQDITIQNYFFKTERKYLARILIGDTSAIANGHSGFNRNGFQHIKIYFTFFF